MKYLINNCVKCGSTNITPYDKRQVGEDSVCKYICEDCGHNMGDTIYAKKEVK